MFTHSGNCFVALPRHVAGELFPKVTIQTAAPVQRDQATVIKPFWEGVDLAVGVVDRGILNSRCIATLDDLLPSPPALGASTAQVLRVTPQGEDERFSIRIKDRTHIKFTAEASDPSDTFMQGTSGAFAFVDGKPIGMALESDHPARATFMRSEEIEMHLRRYLSQQGGTFITPEPAPAPPSEMGPGLPFRVHGVNMPPSLPQYAPENVLGDGDYIFRPSGIAELLLLSESGRPASVSRLRMISPMGTLAIPKDVVIYLDHSEGGQRARFWAAGQMTPDGIFDTGRLAPQNARWVKIMIRSYWSNATEAAISSVRVD